MGGARGIIHLHSPYSHDACDGRPRGQNDDGPVDEACLADLRAALCELRIDYAALTDHDGTMADEAFDDLLLVRDDDEVLAGGAAKRMTCANGHRVTWFVGGENDLMPIMIDRHPDGDADARHAAYNAWDAEHVQLFRDLGGLSWVAHTEQENADELQGLAPDGLEIYNLHANLDPDLREEFLGLEPGAAIVAVADFADPEPTGPEPDLALISFLEPSAPAIAIWDELWSRGVRVWGSAGTDAHQNALPIELRDGERGDSYRRMMRWFSNVALVDDASDPAAIEAAVAEGRMFVAFELFGTPEGYRFERAGDALELSLPVVHALDPSLPAPAVRGRILRIDAAGAAEVAAGDGAAVTAAVEPGAIAYRAEVLITPLHLGPYLGTLGPELAAREHVWIYSNPLPVE